MSPEYIGIFTREGELSSNQYENISLVQRAGLILYSKKFIPENNREINEAFSLIGFRAKPSGVASHLNQILLHQRRANTDQPLAAVKSVAREYAGYYNLARARLENFTRLNVALRGIENRNEYIHNKESIKPYFFDLVRFIDLTAAVGEQIVPENVNLNPFSNQYKISDNLELNEHIDLMTQKIRVHEVKHIARDAIYDQNNRITFWRDILVESANHLGAKAIALSALERNNDV